MDGTSCGGRWNLMLRGIECHVEVPWSCGLQTAIEESSNARSALQALQQTDTTLGDSTATGPLLFLVPAGSSAAEKAASGGVL